MCLLFAILLHRGRRRRLWDMRQNRHDTSQWPFGCFGVHALTFCPCRLFVHTNTRKHPCIQTQTHTHTHVRTHSSHPHTHIYTQPRFSNLLRGGSRQPGSGGGFWDRLFGTNVTAAERTMTNGRPYGEVGTLVRERRVPVKIEPKVFFANERTFLAWMHASILLAGASVAIVAVADSNPMSQIYGLILLPVSIAFIGYSMYQCEYCTGGVVLACCIFVVSCGYRDSCAEGGRCW